jgi:hypothetical protein
MIRRFPQVPTSYNPIEKGVLGRPQIRRNNAIQLKETA